MTPDYGQYMPSGQQAEMQARLEALQKTQAEIMTVEVELRRQVVSYGWLLCTCRPWYSQSVSEPPQANCIVHGNLMVTLDGEVI